MTEANYYVRELSVADSHLKIGQEIETDVGGVVWDSALVAAYYFAKNPLQWKGKQILELGAGTGVCSLVLSTMGADVVCTDLKERLPLIDWNKRANNELLKGNFEVRVLDWCAPGEITPVDVLLLVDCVYYNASVDPLVATILATPATEILCFYEVRDIGEPVEAQRKFIEKISEKFSLEYLTENDLDPDYNCDEIKAIRLIKNVSQ